MDGPTSLSRFRSSSGWQVGRRRKHAGRTGAPARCQSRATPGADRSPLRRRRMFRCCRRLVCTANLRSVVRLKLRTGPPLGTRCCLSRPLPPTTPCAQHHSFAPRERRKVKDKLNSAESCGDTFGPYAGCTAFRRGPSPAQCASFENELHVSQYHPGSRQPLLHGSFRGDAGH